MVSDPFGICASKDIIADTFDRLGRKRSVPPGRLVSIRFLAWIGLSVWSAFVAAQGYAQELEPRSYTNTPVGLNFLIIGDGYLKGSVLTDPSLPLKDAKLHAQMPIAAYARSLNLWGKSGKVGAVFPYACASGSAEFAGQSVGRDVCGWGDPRIKLSMNLYGAPALSLKEFADYKQDLIFGTSLQIGIPLGRYDADRLLNIGTHRWSIKPEFGLSKAIGPLILELIGEATFYTENDSFLGDKRREQDPIFSVQGHLIYGFRSGIWLALDANLYRGGRTTIDGTRSDDMQQNTRLGATLALPVNRYNSIKLNASQGVITRSGGNFKMIGIAWQYRWGGGL